MDTSVDWQTAFQYIAATGFILMAGAVILAVLDKSVHRFPFVGIPQIACVPVGLFGREFMEEHAANAGAAAGSDTELTRTPSLTEHSPLLSSPPAASQDCCTVQPNDVEMGSPAQLSGWELMLSSDRRPLLLAITHGLMIFTVAFPIKLSVTYGLEVSYSMYGAFDYNVYYYMTVAVGLGICVSRMMIVAMQKWKGDKFGGLIQSKIMQLGSAAVMIVLASIPLGSMTVSGACVGMALYCYFAGGE